jgi:hypothetical protein
MLTSGTMITSGTAFVFSDSCGAIGMPPRQRNVPSMGETIFGSKLAGRSSPPVKVAQAVSKPPNRS